MVASVNRFSFLLLFGMLAKIPVNALYLIINVMNSSYKFICQLIWKEIFLISFSDRTRQATVEWTTDHSTRLPRHVNCRDKSAPLITTLRNPQSSAVVSKPELMNKLE